MVTEVIAVPGFLYPAAFAFGLVVGSFLNVVVHRLPRGESIVRPRSRCPSCGAAIRAWDNVPVFSYLLLGGRCRACGVRISVRYPLVEALTGTLFLIVAMRYGASAIALVWMAFVAALLVAALVDFDYRIIPDEISLAGLACGLLIVPLVRIGSGAVAVEAFQASVTGALLGGGMLWSVGFVHARYAAATGRRFEHWPGPGEALPRPASLDYWTWFPGMGFGDVKLMAMIGAFLGPVGVIQTIVAASLLGLAWGVLWAAVTRSWSTPFGFGPALALGAVLVVVGPADRLLR